MTSIMSDSGELTLAFANQESKPGDFLFVWKEPLGALSPVAARS